ncbi:MAG: histidine kinase dimerization/phosphoacceptor domain -containing protein [Pseudotabrizicola sp.]|uniref:sensor histidine kinase n=1 Tax=Pseudotabrizicola sp. TaxID=2939647 RepID=UPI002721B543|nr:histidine kinase dimerization/phosphoacceptor domain -containing protein [Pseudotabrizicola sp.]MDO8884419.1 histidine kinase dimerization/phosphoacceptor domain -containing protein [Pseudotabrizicola sp.]MDP2081470.1 histidine kinase dimerization/phosphoacceptor domain -containing protein [Pseudotabrizicola sp.]MDZ7572983.1 histidine kinase dimerization/phosphoacceptor domain -containing protein [Pseudotabrizicola sp.]
MEQLRLWAVAERSPVYQIVFACLAILISASARAYLESALPPGFPYLTFFPAVILTAFFAGTRAGVAVAVVCGLIAWYWFLAPDNSFALLPSSVLALAFYMFIVITQLVLVHVMRYALSKLEVEKHRSDTLAHANKTMFHELQHRVSNNLQVVSSLLKMQRRNVADEAARAALDVASARLQVVASIQRQLHNPKRQTTDMGHLMRDVLPEVVSSSALSDRITLDFDVEPVIVSADQATPLALIIVELVSNAVEHAAHDTKKTHLHLTMRSRGPEAIIIVQDDGKGLPPDFAPEKSRSLGLRVALQFTEQLDGTLTFETVNGTRVTLTIPLDGADKK